MDSLGIGMDYTQALTLSASQNGALRNSRDGRGCIVIDSDWLLIYWAWWVPVTKPTSGQRNEISFKSLWLIYLLSSWYKARQDIFFKLYNNNKKTKKLDDSHSFSKMATVNSGYAPMMDSFVKSVSMFVCFLFFFSPQCLTDAINSTSFNHLVQWWRFYYSTQCCFTGNCFGWFLQVESHPKCD